MKTSLVLLVLVAISLAGVGEFVYTGELFSLGLDAWDLAMAGAGLAIPYGPGKVFSNPAALAGGDSLVVGSTLGSGFGQTSTSAIAAQLAWLGVGGVRLSASDDGTALLHEGAALALGVPVSGLFSLGGRMRVLHLVLPAEYTGWAVDVAALYRGEVAAAVLIDALLASAPTPGEDWSTSVSLGIALPLALGDLLSGWVAFAATGIGEDSASARLGIELWVGGLGLRAGISPEAAALGVSAGWRNFQLDLAVELNAALSAAFAASLIVRLG
ncbi:hypothetical protein DRJ54_06615 [Candidatus Acetothermia bacterium]|nr:MAG: hypothetical protein DRJ54_06615 [Candidatus Acetothermia bacterium]